MFRLTLLLAILSLSILGLKAQNDCNCNQQVVVQVNAQCTYVLTKTQLGIKNCPDSYIVVVDNKPQNRDTIDAPGSYTYGLYQNDGRLICLGNVMAMSPSGPVLDSVNFLQDTFSFQQVEETRLHNQSISYCSGYRFFTTLNQLPYENWIRPCLHPIPKFGSPARRPPESRLRRHLYI